MRPLYLIVNNGLVVDYLMRNPAEFDEHLKVSNTLDMVMMNEDYVEVKGWIPNQVPKGLPKDRKIMVCGAFNTPCVSVQYAVLKDAGYDAEIYKEATLKIKELK